MGWEHESGIEWMGNISYRFIASTLRFRESTQKQVLRCAYDGNLTFE